MPAGRPPGRYSTNEHAARATIRALERDGKLTDVDALLVTDILTLAEAVDASPNRAVLRKEYREAAAELRRLHDDDDAPSTDLIAAMFAEVGDTETDRPAYPRPASRRSRQTAGDSVHAAPAVGRRRGAGAPA